MEHLAVASQTSRFPESASLKIPMNPSQDCSIKANKRLYVDQINSSRRRSSNMADTPIGVYISYALEESSSNFVGGLVKAAVFGGLDGLITVFAIIAGCVGVHLVPTQVFLIGVGNLVADGFSMGFGEYMSARTENEYAMSERTKYSNELDSNPAAVKEKMVTIFEAKYHFSREDARNLVALASTCRNYFLSQLLFELAGITYEESEESTPFRQGVVMFVSFCVCGALPLMAFYGFLLLMGNKPHMNAALTMHAFMVSIAVVMCALFLLGLAKASYTNQDGLKSGLVMCISGIVVSLVAYSAGFLTKM